MKAIFFLFALVALIQSYAGEETSYTGYKLFRLLPKNAEEAKIIQELEEKDDKLDIWAESMLENKRSVDVMISPENVIKYMRLFKRKAIDYTIVSHNVQNLIDEETRSIVKQRIEKASRNDRNIVFTYATYSEMISFIDTVSEDNPNIATTQLIGRSIEDRQLKVLIIQKGLSATKSIWIDCGIHAREWVTPATCIYIIDQLIKDANSGSDPVTNTLLTRYNFHILAQHNPDGYEFSRTTTRLWRKNRRVNTGSTCLGVDLNRNFNQYWGLGGSSTLQCSDTFMGATVNSEPETVAVQNYLLARCGTMAGFYSLHTYGQWWLTPYGHTAANAQQPADLQNVIMPNARIGMAAIKAYNNNQGSNYVGGPSSQLLYIVTGGSNDWFYDKCKVPFSYVLELRPGQDNPDAFYGFTLPVDRVKDAASEAWLGMKASMAAIPHP